MQKACFIKQLLINAPAEDVFQWHTRPGALERLSPPWDPIDVSEQHGGINKDATVLLNKKRKIIQSRIKAAASLSETIANLEPPPKVFLNASAIGYYGN